MTVRTLELNSDSQLADFDIFANDRLVSPNKDRHVALPNNTYFSILLKNNYNTRVQADIYLNGRVGNDKAFVGSWILSRGQSGSIETYKSKGEKFIFTVDDNSFIGAAFDSKDWGLVSVRFRTEAFEQEVKFKGFDTITRSGSKGVIGLGEQSSQTFGSATPITQYGNTDYIKSVRLVQKTEVKPINYIPEYNYPV